MAKKEKTLQKWERATSETWETVEAVLKRNGFIEKGKSDGSHHSFVHPALAHLVKKFPRAAIIAPYGPDGRIEIICHHGQTVPGYILERILDALQIIDDYYRLENSGKEE